jgi:hypothetical protein
MGIVSFDDVSNSRNWMELRRWVSVALQTLRQGVNGNITFGQNIQSAGPYTLSFDAAGILSQRHDFGKTPSGYLIIKQTTGVNVSAPQASQYAWQDAIIWLESGGAGSVTFYLI